MSRGGHREGAGRKGGWKNSETQVIRVPKVFVAQLMDIAKRLDLGESEIFIFPTAPKLDPVEMIVESEILQVNPDQMDLFSLPAQTNESVTKSKTLSLSMRQLSKRLGMHHSTISKKLKNHSLPDVLDWIQSKGKGTWTFDLLTSRFSEILDDCPDF